MDSFSLTLILIGVALDSSAGKLIPFELSIAEVTGDEKILRDEQRIFLEDSFLSPEPPSIIFDDIDDQEQGPTPTLPESPDNEEDDQTEKRVINSSNRQILLEKKGRLLLENHAVFSLSYYVGSQWSDWTCCRRLVNIQSRERLLTGRKIDVDYRNCTTSYCESTMCKENTNLCKKILLTIPGNLCDPNSRTASFMSHHCPKTCKFCSAPSTVVSSARRVLNIGLKMDRTIPTTLPPRKKDQPQTQQLLQQRNRNNQRRPHPYYFTTTPQTRRTLPAPIPAKKQSRQHSTLEKVTVLKHDLDSPIPSYKFSIGDTVRVTSPWSRISSDSSSLSSFSLYSKPTGVFRTAIAFCWNRDPRGLEKWSVAKTRCEPGWHHKYSLYGSTQRTKSSILYFVGTRSPPYESSIVSKTFPISAYRSGLFVFYGPDSKSDNIIPTRPYYTTRRPTASTATKSHKIPRQEETYRIPTSMDKELSPFNMECLEAHNFFRAIHNVPPLQWSAKLARSAQQWADQLKSIAPQRPTSLDKPHMKTPSWPHSVAGSKFRDRNDGENIAWDLSGDGSPAKESILRFYIEIFYYNRKHPTYAPGRNKPVGHVTQLLWKDTTHVGCGTAQSIVGSFKSKSTWTVIHYSPGGNHRYRSSVKKTVELYDVQVPEMGRGSCMTRSGGCNRGNQCMALGPANGKCLCSGGKPECSSPNGCIAWCENKRGYWPWREECEGKSRCRCTTAGAVCS